MLFFRLIRRSIAILRLRCKPSIILLTLLIRKFLQYRLLDTINARDPIPESGHERLWQNSMREKDIYIYYLRLFILTLMAAFGQMLLALKIYSAYTCTTDFQH